MWVILRVLCKSNLKCNLLNKDSVNGSRRCNRIEVDRFFIYKYIYIFTNMCLLGYNCVHRYLPTQQPSKRIRKWYCLISLC